MLARSRSRTSEAPNIMATFHYFSTIISGDAYYTGAIGVVEAVKTFLVFQGIKVTP